MDYKCFLCSKEFNDFSLTIKHLKIIHNISGKLGSFMCVANRMTVAPCLSSFNQVRTLKNHVGKCVAEAKVFFRASMKLVWI